MGGTPTVTDCDPSPLALPTRGREPAERRSHRHAWAAGSMPTSSRSCAATPLRRGSMTPSSSTPAPSQPRPCARRRRPSASSGAKARSARIIVTGCAAQIEPERFADMPEVDAVVGNAEKMRPETFRGLSCRRQPARAGQRHHVGARDGARHDRRLRLARPRLCAGPERVRSPLHLLHHPLRSRAVALGSGRRGRGAGAPAGRSGLSRDRADRRGHHVLRRRPAGRHDAGHAGAPRPAPRAGAQAPSAVVDRPGRSRQASDGCHRRRSRA